MARLIQDHFLPPQLAASFRGGVDLQNKWYATFTPEGEMIGTVNLMYHERGDCLVHWMHGAVYPRVDQEKVIAEFPRTGDLMKRNTLAN